MFAAEARSRGPSQQGFPKGAAGHLDFGPLALVHDAGEHLPERRKSYLTLWRLWRLFRTEYLRIQKLFENYITVSHETCVPLLQLAVLPGTEHGFSYFETKGRLESLQTLRGSAVSTPILQNVMNTSNR